MEEIKLPTMIKLQEAADLTGLPYYRIWKLCRENKVVNIRAGKRFYINKEKLMNYLNGESGR